MKTVKIISDSTCDLSKELIERYDISILPQHIVLGDTEYTDGVDITPDEIYQWSDENKTTPKTSAPVMAEAMELMQPYLAEGRELICFCISETMSCSGQAMRMAAEELETEDKVTVIDSENLSTGIGHLVIEAAILAQEGKNAAQITEEIEKLKSRVRASFVTDTLVYLSRGGRCSAAAAIAGSMLKLHPKIVVKDGVMDASKKYRGKMSSVIMSYVKDMEEELKQAKPDRVFITHSGCNTEIIQNVLSYLQELHIFKEILITRAGCVVSSHCGPGTLGVLYIADGK